jgi:hypothetical protein
LGELLLSLHWRYDSEVEQELLKKREAYEQSLIGKVSKLGSSLSSVGSLFGSSMGVTNPQIEEKSASWDSEKEGHRADKEDRAPTAGTEDADAYPGGFRIFSSAPKEPATYSSTASRSLSGSRRQSVQLEAAELTDRLSEAVKSGDYQVQRSLIYCE